MSKTSISGGRNRWAGSMSPLTIDDCVRLVTAADSFDELKGTLPTYAPKFYSKATSSDQANAQRRVVAAFNAWATREGREARAFFADCAR